MRIWWGAAGLDPHLHQAGCPAALQHPDMAQGPPPFQTGGVDRAQARMGDGTDGHRHVEGVAFRRSLGQGQVGLLDPVLPQGLAERPAGSRRPREEHHPRGAAAQAVDRRGLGAAPAHEGEQGVVEEAAAGEGGQAGGLGRREELRILAQDGPGQGDGGLLPGWAEPGQPLSLPQEVLQRRGPPFHVHQAGLDPGLPRGARGVRAMDGEVLQDGPSRAARVDDLGVGESLVHSFRMIRSMPTALRPSVVTSTAWSWRSPSATSNLSPFTFRNRLRLASFFMPMTPS